MSDTSSTPSVSLSPKIEREQLSPEILQTYESIAREKAIFEYDLLTQPIGGLGENSYGSVLKVHLIPKTNSTATPLRTILKMAPTSPARRAHMLVKEVYTREVFMYEQLFKQFYSLFANTPNATPFDIVPQMLYASLTEGTEYIIFEDLSACGYSVNPRSNLPTNELVVCAFRAIAQLHSMSFVLQARCPQLFASMVADMRDNLFTPDTALVTIEFGKKYVRRTRQMLEQDENITRTDERSLLMHALLQIEQRYKELCLDAVNGASETPYSVVCHGDFWNNNILYEFKQCSSGRKLATGAKLIDFQISRYAPPVLDLVHYLYACTEKPLRDAHFQTFMCTYYEALATHLASYQLDINLVYPEQVFQRQLRDYGIFGFCMSALSIPFFVSTASELPELDEVCEALQELPSSERSTNLEGNNNNNAATIDKPETAALKLLDDYDLLTERTLPLFKQRMLGNALDLHKYEMLGKVMNH